MRRCGLGGSEPLPLPTIDRGIEGPFASEGVKASFTSGLAHIDLGPGGWRSFYGVGMCVCARMQAPELLRWISGALPVGRLACRAGG